MGIYNLRKDLPKSLKDNKCPLSGYEIKPTDFKLEQDSFEYICEDINPNSKK